MRRRWPVLGRRRQVRLVVAIKHVTRREVAGALAAALRRAALREVRAEDARDCGPKLAEPDEVTMSASSTRPVVLGGAFTISTQFRPTEV